MAKCLQDASAYTVAWITALEIERAAATAQLDEPHEEPEGFEQHQSDHNSYDWGRIGKHNVVIASLPSGQMGTTPAAFTVSNLLASLPWIRFGLFVGIGGGIPRLPHRDIRLGDVVISQPTKTTGGVVQYDKSAAVSGGKRQLRSVLNSPPTVLLHALSAMKAKHEGEIPQIVGFLEEMKKNRPRMIERGYIHQGFENDKLYSTSYEHVRGATCVECDTSYILERTERTTTEPGIHYGLIASGNTLFKDAAARAELESLIGEEEECLCVEMEAAGIVNNFPCIVIRGICDYADSHKNDRWQRYASATAAVYAKELLGYVHAQKLKKTKPLREAMAQSIQEIQEGVNKVESRVEDLKKSSDTAELQRAIDRLPSVVGASFDSTEESYNRKCLPGTRVELLDMVQAWAEDPAEHSVLWLHGAAGSGKSTISRSVCDRLTKRNRSNYLGASFFFKRGGGDRGSLRNLFTTMASQLAQSQPRLARYMKEAFDIGSDVVDMELSLQFEKLIMTPLEKDAKDNPTSKQHRLLPVFVVDALDECIGSNETGLDGSVRRLIQVFLDARKVGLKVFITSRPELPMRLEFGARQGEYHDLALLEVPKQLVKRDISIFLRHQFSLIKTDWNRLEEGNPLPQHWPSGDDFKSLLDMAVPLFIIASTVCLFMGDFQFGSPKRQLRDILKSGTRAYGLPLADLYTPVLHSILHKDSPEQHVMHLKRFHDIIGPLILLEIPQSMSTLANLLGIELDYIEAHFKRYHSVLYVPSSMKSPVRLLHLSFKDFLLRKESHDKIVQVDEGSVHGTLAEKCSRVMVMSLTKDICDVRWPGTLRTSISSKRVERYIPSEVRYACIYWAHHLQQAKSPIDGECVYQFLRQYLLYWTEALVYLGKIRELPQMLEDLRTLATRQGRLVENLRNLLDEGIPWIRHYLPIIETNPLQIYASALVFTPTTSLIRRTFQHDLPNWISTQPNCYRVWDTQLLQHLSSQADWICTSLEFSQDGTLFAAVGYESAKKDHSCRFWLVRTGEMLHELSLGFFTMWSELMKYRYAFSNSSKMIASVGKGKKVQLWDLESRDTKWEAALSSLAVSIVFTPDDSALLIRVADGLEGTYATEHWSVSTGKLVSVSEKTVYQDSPFYRHHNDVGIPTRKPKSSANTPSLTRTGDSRYLGRYTSPDGSEQIVVQIWDRHTRNMIRKSVFHDTAQEIMNMDASSSLRLGKSAALSHNLRLFAYVSQDTRLRILSADTGNCIHGFLLERGMFIRELEFSRNDTAIVCKGFMGKFLIWDLASGKASRHSVISSRDLVLSPDFSIAASQTSNGDIKILRIDRGSSTNNVRYAGEVADSGAIFVSPDSSTVAIISGRRQQLEIWNTDTHTKISHFYSRNEEHKQSRCEISPTSLFFAMGRKEVPTDLYICRVSSGKAVHRTKGFWPVAFVDHDDSTTFAIASCAGEANIVKVSTLRHYNGWTNGAKCEGWKMDSSRSYDLGCRNMVRVESIALSSDLTRVAIGFHRVLGRGVQIKIFSISSGDCLRQIHCHRFQLGIRMTFASSSLLLVAGIENKRLFMDAVGVEEDTTTLSDEPCDILHQTLVEGVEVQCDHEHVIRLSSDHLFTRDQAFRVDISRRKDCCPGRWPTLHEVSPSGIGLGRDAKWITGKDKNLIWVPREFRQLSQQHTNDYFWSRKSDRIIVLRNLKSEEVGILKVALEEIPSTDQSHLIEDIDTEKH